MIFILVFILIFWAVAFLFLNRKQLMIYIAKSKSASSKEAAMPAVLQKRGDIQ